MSEEEILTILYFWQERVSKTQEEIDKLIPKKAISKEIIQSPKRVLFVENDIYKKLAELLPTLAHTYAQVKIDLDNQDRLSWVGTAHGIREVLRGILDHLAPDNIVKEQEWYKQETKTTKPTHRQKVKYILQEQDAGSNKKKVYSKIDELDKLLEGFISGLVRDTYSRASDASHRFKEKKEVERILRYFEAFAHDLLGL